MQTLHTVIVSLGKKKRSRSNLTKRKQWPGLCSVLLGFVVNNHILGRKCVMVMVGVTRLPLLVLPVLLRPIYMPGCAADSYAL